MAAQLSLTNGLSLRWLFSKRLVATSSLPVPLSPRMSTVESVGATFMIRLSRPRMARLSPMISGKKCRASMRLSAEVTRSKTVVNCSILSIDHSFFDLGLGVVLNAGSLLAFSKNSSTGRRINRTMAKPAAYARVPITTINQKTHVAGSDPWARLYLVIRKERSAEKMLKPAKMNGTMM